MTTAARVGCVVTVMMLAVASGNAQGKKKPAVPDKWPGTADFRCNVTACSDPDDRVLGDDSRYALLTDGNTGAGLYSGVGEMHINLLNPSPYEVTLDFSQPVDVNPPCSVNVSCRFPYEGLVITLTTRTEIQNNVVDAAGNEVSGGLFSVPINETRRSRLRFDFMDPGGQDIRWHVRFNSQAYAGATDLNVTRTGTCTWVFEPGATDVAGIWGFGAAAGMRKAIRTDEGRYHMPLKITFNAYDAPGCPPRP